MQERNEDDSDRRLQFSELMSHLLIEYLQVLFNICFTHERKCYLNGAVNKHNCR